MCGIAGMLDHSGDPISYDNINNMINMLNHRGPDGEGVFINETFKIGLGHKRLSIIDLSENASQPMTISDRYTITFNGEIYNYIEIKKILIKYGFNFYSDSDTEVLINSYIKWGVNCLNYFDGMFSFAIWDNKKNELFCARDRFGEKPFFYTKYNSKFIFASEIKAIAATGIPVTPCYKSILNYLLYGTIRNPNKAENSSTFYENIIELEPAHYLLIKNTGDISDPIKYWDLDVNKKTKLNFEDCLDKFDHLLYESTQRRLRSDVSVGSSLSGGLDSSTIVYNINKIRDNNHSQTTFSARFKGSSVDEGRYMNAVIESLPNIKAHFGWYDYDLITNNIDKVFDCQEGPFGSPSILVQNEIMKLARKENVKVLLDGQGADEYLGGYHYFKRYFYIDAISKLKISNIKDHIIDSKSNTISALLSMTSDLFFPNLKHHLRKKKIKKKCKSINNDFIESFYDVDDYPFRVRKNIDQWLYDSTLKTGLRELLRYADRNSMNNSIEVRLPFLYHELVEFVFSIPNSYKFHQGWTKYILRKSIDNKLPDSITWRKDKIGYAPPTNDWLSNFEVKNMIKESQEYLKKNNIIESVIETQNWNYLMIHRLLEHKYI